MFHDVERAARWFVLATLTAACTDAPLYSKLGGEPVAPDRVAVAGELCTEDTSGSAFPIKLLLVTDQSLDMFVIDPDNFRFNSPPAGSLSGLRSRFRFAQHVSFGYIGLADAPRALPNTGGQVFYRPQDTEVDLALAQLAISSGNRRDVLAALTSAESFILNDINVSSPGEVLRSRYVVSFLMAGPPNPWVDHDELGRQLERMSENIHSRGALEFRLNTNLLYYGPRTIDLGTDNFQCYRPDAADPPCGSCPSAVQSAYCAVFCNMQLPRNWDQDFRDATRAYEAMAFAGAGIFRDYPCPAQLDFNVDIADSHVQLVKKDILAYNVNMQLGFDGPLVDSDGDGLADIHEAAADPPTSIDLQDTDCDGIGDRVEFRAFPSQDPTDPTDRPPSCAAPDVAPICGRAYDRDRDQLNDCEEGLLQSSASIPDTDGDGLPDLIEFLGGTIPTSADDRLLDFDGDGIPNAQEVLEHTNPRGSDALLRGSEGYRNNIESLGEREVVSMENPDGLRGVVFRRASATSAPGQSFMRWDGCSNTLEWSDASYPESAPPFEPIPVNIPSSGIYELCAQAPNGQQVCADFQITLEFMPPCSDGVIEARPILRKSVRNCYDVRISNIKLMRTEPANGEPAGMNRILVFFTQSPETRLASPGIAKVAEIKVQYACADPDRLETCNRNPRSAVFELTDNDFLSDTPF